MNTGTLLLRGTIGPFFVGHGAQKLFGVAGGGGLRGTAQMFDSIGIKPGLVQAGLAGSAEMLGGAGLVLGYRTPLAASAIVATMTTAIQKVHLENGWSVQDHGYEYNAVLIAGAVAIAERGPGKLSLDALRRKQRSGAIWGLFALGAGVGGAIAADRVSGYFGGAGEPAPEPAAVPQAAPEPASEPASGPAVADAFDSAAEGSDLPVEFPADPFVDGSDS